MLHPTHTQKKKLKGLIKIKKEEAFETKHVSPTSQTKTLFLQCWASLILSSPSHCIEEEQQRKRIRETSSAYSTSTTFFLLQFLSRQRQRKRQCVQVSGKFHQGCALELPWKRLGFRTCASSSVFSTTKRRACGLDGPHEWPNGTPDLWFVCGMEGEASKTE